MTKELRDACFKTKSNMLCIFIILYLQSLHANIMNAAADY